MKVKSRANIKGILTEGKEYFVYDKSSSQGYFFYTDDGVYRFIHWRLVDVVIDEYVLEKNIKNMFGV